MEDGEDGVSYETLQDLLRQERRSNKLIPVRNGFWSDLQDFLKDAEAEFRDEQAKDPWNRKAMMLSDRVKNARHAAETVWSLRERKLAMLALAHAADGGHPDGLTKKELTLYEALLATLREGREEVFEGTAAAPRKPRAQPAVPTPSPAAEAPPEPAPGPAHDEAPEPPETVPTPGEAEDDERDDEGGDGPDDDAAPAPDDEDEEARPAEPEPEPAPPAAVPPDTPDDGIVTIRALGDIPPFVGPDMDTYRLKEGDLASVPENIANLLVKRGKAAVVQAS